MIQIEQPVYRDFRAGDVRHSLADISKAATLLGYQPTHRIGEGMKVAMAWYVRHATQPALTLDPCPLPLAPCTYFYLAP